MDRKEFYTEQLATLIRLPTISYYEKNVPEPFDELRGALPVLFPNLMRTAETELFSGSILMRWRGSENAGPVLFMNHHDVVTAGEGWTHEPFGAEVSSGRLWGRGTLDTKGGFWAMLQAADELCASGFIPGRDIYFMSSCNEETTFNGAREISEELKRRGLHFDMVLDEGGMILYEPIGGVKGLFAMIGCGERGCVDLKFTAKGRGGHASSPEKDAPLVRLGRFMADADRAKLFPADLEPPIQEMFRRMAPFVSGPLKFIYGHPVFFGPVLRSVMPKLSATSRALVQSTLAFTMAQGAERCSIMPNEACVCCNMRFSHHQGYEDSLKTISDFALKYGIETYVLDPGGVTELSDYNDPMFRLMESAVKGVFPDANPTPYIMTGCSDARFMSALSENIYHFTPFIIDSAQLDSIHGADECVDTDNLIPAVEFYKYLMTKSQ